MTLALNLRHSLKNNVLNKIVHTYWTRLLATALVFASVVLTSRFLGAEGKGVTSLIATNILFITLLNDMVGGVSLIYLTPRYRLASLVIPTALFTVLCSLLATAIFHFLEITPAEYTIHLYLLAVLQSLNNIALNVLLGKENIKLNNYLFLFKTIINVAFLAFFFIILKEPNVLAYIYAMYASNMLPLLAALPILISYWRNDTGTGSFKSALRELVSLGSQSQFANIIQMLNYRLSFYLLNALLFSEGKKAVGIFSIVLALADVIWMMSKSIGTVQLTRISNMADVSQSHDLTKKFLRFSVMSSMLLLLPALLVPANFYALIFGNEFGEANGILLMMAGGVLVFSINIILANHFAGTGRYRVNMTASLIGLPVNILANVLLIPKLGLAGAGIAASLTYAVITFYTWLQFIKESTLNWKDLVVKKEDIKKLIALAERKMD